jgi:NAD(P)-dependent dehydrogenase (short-subunit alcohol dehydrogenase family)
MYLDRFNLRGRVAVVAGGAQSIGLACVEALSEAGAHFYITDRNPTAAAEGRAEMKAKGYATDFIEMEVTDSKQVDAAAARVMTEKAASTFSYTTDIGVARKLRAYAAELGALLLKIAEIGMASSPIA